MGHKREQKRKSEVLKARYSIAMGFNPSYGYPIIEWRYLTNMLELALISLCLCCVLSGLDTYFTIYDGLKPIAMVLSTFSA